MVRALLTMAALDRPLWTLLPLLDVQDARRLLGDYDSATTASVSGLVRNRLSVRPRSARLGWAIFRHFPLQAKFKVQSLSQKTAGESGLQVRGQAIF